MLDPEDHPSEEPMDSSAFPEAYSEALKQLRNSLVHQSFLPRAKSLKEHLKEFMNPMSHAKKTLQKALESFQAPYALFRLRAEISALEEKAP